MEKRVKMYTYSGRKKQHKIDAIVQCGMPADTVVHTYNIARGEFLKLSEAHTIDMIRNVRNSDNFVLVFVQQEEEKTNNEIIDEIIKEMDDAVSERLGNQPKQRNDMLDAMTYGIDFGIEHKAHSLREYNLEVHDDDNKYVNAEHPEQGTVRQERKYKYLYDQMKCAKTNNELFANTIDAFLLWQTNQIKDFHLDAVLNLREAVRRKVDETQ